MALGVEVDDVGIAGVDPDGGARELAVDTHPHVLIAVGSPWNTCCCPSK